MNQLFGECFVEAMKQVRYQMPTILYESIRPYESHRKTLNALSNMGYGGKKIYTEKNGKRIVYKIPRRGL